MRIVALDLSLTGTGLTDDGESRTIKTKLRDEPRLDFILNEIMEHIISPKNLNENNADLVIIEGLAYAAKVGKSAERDALHYMVRWMLWKHDVPFAICPPTVLKKYLSGRGNASKFDMLLAGASFFPNVKNDNEMDSKALWAMAMHKVGLPVIQVPKANLATLDKVIWPEGF